MLYSGNNNSIEPVKSISVFEPYRWLETFGKSLTRNIIEAKIIHTFTGASIIFIAEMLRNRHLK